MKIRHDNTGLSSSWFLDRVEVEDTANEAKVGISCLPYIHMGPLKKGAKVGQILALVFGFGCF